MSEKKSNHKNDYKYILQSQVSGQSRAQKIGNAFAFFDFTSTLVFLEKRVEEANEWAESNTRLVSAALALFLLALFFVRLF